MKETFKDIVWWLVNFTFIVMAPLYWIQNERTNWKYDKQLRKALEEHDVKVVDYYIASVGGVELWTQNFPYNFGCLNTKSIGLPSPLTRRKLKRLVSAQLKQEGITKTSDINPWEK